MGFNWLIERDGEAPPLIANVTESRQLDYEFWTPKPFCMRRGAEGQTDKGSCLFERSEFARDPGWTEHRRLPVAKPPRANMT